MPGMSGYVLAQRIRQNYPGIPVGAITAHAGKQEKFKCAKFGIADILVKPASLKNIKEFIGKNIDRKSTRLNSSHLVISYAVFCLKKKKYILAFNSVQR